MAKTVEDKLTPIYNASSEDVEVLYTIKDGKRAVTPVILCDIDGNPIDTGGGGTELDPIWVADKPNYYTKSETNAQLDTKQDTLVAGENITIDPTTNTISSTGGGSGTDTKLSIDPLKTKWDGTNKNLVLSNTDDTNITIPMDTLIDYVEYSNNNDTLNDAIDLKSDLTYVDSNFTNLGSALTEKADKVDVYTKSEIDASSQGSYSRRATIGVYAINDGVIDFNLFSDTIDFTEISNLLVTTFSGTTTNRVLKFAPNTKTGNKDTYSIELRIFSTVPPSEGSGSTRQDIRFDLVSGTNDNLISRGIVTRNDFSNGAAKVNFDTFTSGATDPMVATGFKILISNTTGVNLTDLSATLLITRTN